MSTNDSLLSIAASITAGIILLAATALLSARARWFLTGILGRLLDVDIDAVFSDKKAGEADVNRELRRARDIAILTGRGNELQRDTFDTFFLHRPATPSIGLRILLSQTVVEPGTYD
jgi:hypothetical protein